MGTRPICTGASHSGNAPRVVLDKHAEEALDRPEERAVHHHGLMALAVFADVLELEARGKVEVELNGRELPEAAENVDELEVDFGAVEGAFAGNGFVGEAATGEDAFEGGFSVDPVFLLADEIAGLGGVVGGELDAVLGKAEGFEHGFGKVDAGVHFVFNLIGCAEDVGVVLGKTAHAQQAMHGAGTLVAINVAKLGVALGQVAIALGRVLVDENVAGAVHRLEAVLGVVKLHGRVHVARVEALVA